MIKVSMYSFNIWFSIKLLSELSNFIYFFYLAESNKHLGQQWKGNCKLFFLKHITILEKKIVERNFQIMKKN